MTKEEILQKAIEKAIQNSQNSKDLWIIEEYKKQLEEETEFYEIHSLDQYYWVFTHDFAKAFWGEDECEYQEFPQLQGDIQTVLYKGKVWQYNLQQMVLEEEPIKYLENFI